MRVTEIELDLKIIKVTFKNDELERTFAAVLDEMRSITARLGEDEKRKLEDIMSRPSGSLLVADVYDDFVRGNKRHDALRAMRDAQFIRPVGGGPWEENKRIEIKAFGRLMWEKVGKNELFAK
jgi:hypothetical protein